MDLSILFQVDAFLLHFINVDMANPVLDRFWLVISHLDRQQWFMFGVLPVILAFLFYMYRGRTFALLAAVALTVGLSDVLCYRVVKFTVNRPRPFQNSEISPWLRKVGDAHGPSFPSNHAANCFAGAVILAWYFRNLRFGFYIFATLVGFSRIALGVHYPSDVVCGAILGFVVGTLITSMVLNRLPFMQLVNAGSSSDTRSGDWRTRIRRPNDD